MPCNRIRLLLFFICLYITGRSQDFAFIHYTRNDGLPSNTIYSIFRDDKGLLWLGTDKGVATYNGISFKTATTFNGLPDNEVFFFRQDYEGRIWMSTLNAELCFYKDGIFHNASNTPFLRIPKKLSTVNYILLEKDSSISIGFYNYPVIVNIYKDHSQTLDFSHLSNHTPLRDIISVKKMASDRYLLYTPDGTLLVDSNAQLIHSSSYQGNAHYAYSIDQGQEYLLNEKGIYTMTQQPILLSNNHNFTARSCRVYRDGKDLFIATFAGLFINGDIHVLKDIKTSAVTQDVDGNYWISTLNDGVYVLSKQHAAIHEYPNTYKGHVNFAYADSGKLLFADADNNLFYFANKQSRCIFKNPVAYRKEKRANQPGYIVSGNTFHAFYNDHHYTITSIWSNKPQSQQYDHTTGQDIKNIYTIGNDICIALSGSIKLSKTGRQKNEVITLLDEKRWRRICTVGQDDAQNLFVSANDSVFKLMHAGGIIYQPQFGNVSFRWGNRYGKYFVGCTAKNRLWIGMAHGDHMLIDTSIQQECIWNSACRLDSTHILISTNDQYRVLTFDEHNTFHPDIQVVENPFIPTDADYVTAGNGQCFFFKNGSLIVAAIPMLLQKARQPSVWFTQLKTHDRTLPVTASHVSLSYEEAKNLSVGFNTVSFSGKTLSYEYATSNSTDTNNWRPLQSNELNLVTPGYGDYTIRVRAKSSSSAESVPAYLVLTIAKPFWAEWWFIILSFAITIIFLALAVFGIVKYLLHKREQQHKAKIKFMKSEYKALNALMNPHFIFNSLNNIQAFINENDKPSASKYLNIFSSMVRQNMHNISREMISLQKEIDLVTNYLKLEKLRFDDWLNFSIEIEEDLELDLIQVPPLLLQPLVENAIRHGLLPKQSPLNHVSIRVFEADGDIKIEVKDNGIGLEHAALSRKSNHESFGLNNIRNRIIQLHEIYQQEITFDISELKSATGNTSGTISTITIRQRK